MLLKVSMIPLHQFNTTSLKTSLARPKLKKLDLKSDLLANYRPIANIPFFSKVLEKSAAIQVHNNLNDNDLFPPLQSAYRKYRSTETALLRVTDNILKTLDSNSEVILVLLDLSAAFDTLDHQILLARLRKYFNFTETALKWFSSYLLGRSQRVSIAEATSPQHMVKQEKIFCNIELTKHDVLFFKVINRDVIIAQPGQDMFPKTR